MANEAHVDFPRPGEIRIGDVCDLLGSELLNLSNIRVFVLGKPGEMSSTGAVFLGWVSGGRGRRRAFVCPKCFNTTRRLFTDGRGGLGCATCTSQRTAWQIYKHAPEYLLHGGRQESELHGVLLGRTSNLSVKGLIKAKKLASYVVKKDRARAAGLLRRVCSTVENV